MNSHLFHDVLWLKMDQKEETISGYTLVLPKRYFFVIPSSIVHVHTINHTIHLGKRKWFVKNTYTFPDRNFSCNRTRFTQGF